MLPASSPTPARSASPTSTTRRPRRSKREQEQAFFASGLLIYALVLGAGLLAGVVRPERSFLLIAAPCVIPMVRYGLDYFRNHGERDSGVLLSAIGWFLIILALVFKQIAVIQAGGNIAAIAASSPLVPICATFGVLCLLTGAIFSWLFWAAGQESSQEASSAHY